MKVNIKNKDNGKMSLFSTFQEFKEFKNIDRETMMRVLEFVFRHMLIKRFGTDENIDIIVNIDKGDLEIWRNRIIVEDGTVEDENLQIEYCEAINIEPDYEIGEEASQEIHMSDFDRREILSIRQNLTIKIQELENDSIYKKYTEKIGEIITGEIYQVWKKEVMIVDDDDYELIIPKSEQIPNDYYRKGDVVRAVVSKVNLRNNKPVVILSRTSPVFLERLLEQEVPEIYDGLITIKNIVRAPGERSKIAVESYDDRIDPVGACVGAKGSRIHGIVRELKNENIDIINYTTNTSLYIQRALSPAKISSINIDDETNKVEVYLKTDQISMAIGKGGQNIKLAGKLTGYQIDVFRDNESYLEDVSIMEFSDEIDQWILDELISIGCDTAKSAIAIPATELSIRTDLEIETINEVLRILNSEFE